MTGSHCTALISSALGQTIPVLILPSMHDSLLAAPAMREHLAKISAWKNVSMLNARTEEGKQKFPVPAQLADEVAHIMNRPLRPTEKILVTMGTTRGYIDDIRYISNYSSGTLGSLICEELYRQGFATFVVAGPCERKPTTATSMKNVLTTSDMLAACTDAENQGLAGGIFCASVLDYEPNETTSGKIKSGKPNFSISFKPTPKIIDLIRLTGLPKIGFKLEVGLSESQTEAVAKDYIKKYNLTMLVTNELASVSATTHRAIAFTKNSQITKLNSKSDIAQHISQQLAQLSAH